MMKSSRARASLSVAVAGSLMLLAGACSKSAETVTSEVNASTTQVSTPTTPESVLPKNPGSTAKKATTSTTKATPTTVGNSPAAQAEFGQQAVEAFKAKLGADLKALDLTVNFNSASNRAEIKVQDPAKPANVDDYVYTGGDIDGPTPVKLTGDGELADNLFVVSAVAWDKLPQMLDQAKAELGGAEGSKGVTHFIVKKNLPFDADTVVNVYVDGGPRADGGYVSFTADGTLKKVYGKK